MGHHNALRRVFFLQTLGWYLFLSDNSMGQEAIDYQSTPASCMWNDHLTWDRFNSFENDPAWRSTITSVMICLRERVAAWILLLFPAKEEKDCKERCFPYKPNTILVVPLHKSPITLQRFIVNYLFFVKDKTDNSTATPVFLAITMWHHIKHSWLRGL